MRQYLNAQDEFTWRLAVAWTIAALYPVNPFPILVVQGEAGSAKSSTSSFLKTLLDPSSSPLRAAPRDERDLMIAAQNSWVLSFDNLSGVKHWQSDAFCRLSTGGGFSTRELYSNDEEKIFISKRPIIINGIDELASRDDLTDRALIIYLRSITNENRRPEVSLKHDYEAARPRILGAFLDILSGALGNLKNVRLPALPRMADFVQLITAAEPGLGWEPGSFARMYMDANRDDASSWVESDSVSTAIRNFLKVNNKFEGTCADLLKEFATLEGSLSEAREWPRNSRSLSSRLRRAAPALRKIGIDVSFGKSDHKRTVYLQQCFVPTVPTVAADPLRVEVTTPSEERVSRPASAHDVVDGGDANSQERLQAYELVRVNPATPVDQPDGKWRCSSCGRMFRNLDFWKSHLTENRCKGANNES